MADLSKQSDKLNIPVITSRLVDLILKMSAKERQDLLNELEEKYKKIHTQAGPEVGQVVHHVDKDN